MRSIYEELLCMRVSVGLLGERAQYDWWSTSFYEPSARPFLEPAFPRTMMLARYHGVVEAARCLHDDHLNRGCYHLFRLPEELEQDLHSLLAECAGDERAEADQESSLAHLRDIAGETKVETVGPVAVGNIEDLLTGTLVKNIAQIYSSAFMQGEKAFPYLVRSR